MSMDRTVRDMMAAMEPKKRPESYDTQATVTRVEGDTLWCHIPGGVDETPVQRTVNASAGDTIQIRVGGGTAWAVGNGTAPPTDDREAIAAQGQASRAQGTADEALETVRLQQAIIERLSAAYAEIDTAVINILEAHGIDADWINAGTVKFRYLEGQLLKSRDYATARDPWVFPAETTYPLSSLYPSRGETVVSGFAIDLQTGEIFGGAYSEDMAALEARVYALEHALTYPKAPATLGAAPASIGTLTYPMDTTDINEEEI